MYIKIWLLVCPYKSISHLRARVSGRATSLNRLPGLSCFSNGLLKLLNTVFVLRHCEVAMGKKKEAREGEQRRVPASKKRSQHTE